MKLQVCDAGHPNIKREFGYPSHHGDLADVGKGLRGFVGWKVFFKWMQARVVAHGRQHGAEHPRVYMEREGLDMGARLPDVVVTRWGAADLGGRVSIRVGVHADVLHALLKRIYQ